MEHKQEKNMTPAITFLKKPRAKSETAIVAIYEGGRLSPSAAILDKESQGLIKACLEDHRTFTGKQGQIISVVLPRKVSFRRAILLGMGKAEQTDSLALETLGGKLMAALKSCGAEHASLLCDTDHKLPDSCGPAEIAARIALGLTLGSYRFDKYQTEKDEKEKDDPAPEVRKLDCVLDAHSAASRLYATYDAVAQGVFLARDLMNEPPNILYPESYAARMREELKPLGINVEIMDEKKMQKLGFGAFLAVGMGSARPPRAVIMRWNGVSGTSADKKKKNGKQTRPIAFVGKGVTFDTGGISIKPSANMDEMKMDMGGSAAVAGLMKTLALRKAKVDVIGAIGLAENMPSSRAYRPGDIVTSCAGKTIEVLNTDAEGRLVLIDLLTHVQRTYNPRMIIDIATLTGAILVALGSEYCGAFVNNDDLWNQLNKAAKNTGEKLWRMPLDEAYRKAMDSKIADLNNLGNLGRYGGACTAAGFLERFVEDDRPWAHLDIAGKMMQKSGKPTIPAGGAGFGVRLLDALVAENYER